MVNRDLGYLNMQITTSSLATHATTELRFFCTIWQTLMVYVNAMIVGDFFLRKDLNLYDTFRPDQECISIVWTVLIGRFYTTPNGGKLSM